MKVQLISAPTSSGKGVNPPFPPLGIMYLVSYVREIYPDIRWKISDGLKNGEDKCIANFRKFKPDLVGISFSTLNAPGAYRLINYIKNTRPDVPVICGGPHPSALPNEVLSKTKADFVVMGEGEKSFLEIIRRMGNGEDLQRENRRVIVSEPVENLDLIPFPARDLVNVTKYPGYLFSKAHPETHILSTRGCPYRCWFCSNPVWRTRKPYYRARSPKNVVDEIELLRDKYGIREFFDQCDEFNVSLKQAIGICDEIIQRGIDVFWKVQMTSRRYNFSEEMVEKMAKSGCWLVFLGIESGNQSTLDGIGKHISLNEVIYICRLLKRYGIKVFGLFMLFNVWEENGELRYEGVDESLATIRFARSLMRQKLIDYMSCTITTPFPASRLWDTCMRFHLIPDEYVGRWELWDLEWNYVMKLPKISDKDWRKVRVEGAKLQMLSVLNEFNSINPRSLPAFTKRLAGMLNSYLKAKFQV